MRSGWRVVAALIPVLLAAWVYYPITRSYFFADDFIWLLGIVNDGVLRFVLRPFGGHNLVVRNLVFYGSYELFGLHAEWYFWTVLVAHLVNVWLLYRVLHRLTASLALASLGAALWGTAPIQAGTLGWYSVFGQVLVATLLLAVLDGVTRHASTGTTPSAREAGLWYALLLLATMCFGTGIGVALGFPVALFLLLPEAWKRPGLRAMYLTLPFVTVASYLAFRRLAQRIEPLSFYETIAGNLTLQRVWGARGLFGALLGAAPDASLRSFFFSPEHYPTPATAVTQALCAGGLVILLWRGGAATRRVVLAMLVLSASVYLVVALGRQPGDTSDAKMHWLAATARYHYVGSMPIVIAACVGVGALGGVVWLRSVPRAPLVLGAFAVGVFGYLRSDFGIDDHAAPRRYLTTVQRGIAAEVDRSAPGETVYLENSDGWPLLAPLPVQEKAVFPGRAAIFLLEHRGDELDGRHLRFVERDATVLARRRQWPDTPLARLLVVPAVLPR